MAVTLDEFTDPTLPAAASDEAYELYRAALEWRLAAPIVIRSGSDILSADRWRDRVQPFHHQVRNLITFCRLAPAVLLADEVGLGKTVSAGLILSELVARRRVGRALVVCPRVLCDQWVRELADKFRIEAVVATGAEWVAACNGAAAVVVTTYETAGRYIGSAELPEDAFQMLILDEAHRLRNLHGPGGPPQFAAAIRDSLAARWFNYVLMLTATPIQNRFTDVYSLIDLLTVAKGHRNPFGDWEEFRSQYLAPRTDGRRLRPHMAERFRQTLNGYVARTRRVDAALPFPGRQVATVRVALTPPEREFERVVGGVVGGLTALAQSSLGEALMSSPAALAAQLERMSAGRPQLAAAAARARAAEESGVPPAKLARLFVLCDELRAARPDWRVVVFTRRRETQEMIRRGLEGRGVSVGLIAGGRPAENRRDTEAFLARPPRVHVLVSTDAGAEGVNLQEANWLVNYDLPWNPMLLEQRIGRVQRLGSPHREVFVQNFVAAGTVEELVVARLMQRLLAVTETVGDLESILEAAEDDSGDDSQSGGEDVDDRDAGGRRQSPTGRRFAARLRELVVRSLQGQDAVRAAEQMAESVELARRDYDANCGQMNRDLGSLDGAEAPAPPPPAFERRPPCLPAHQFVRRALAADGRDLREVRPGLLEEARARAGAAEQIALTPQAAEGAGGPVTPYYPGQRPFERLVERWAGRPCHRVLDLRGVTDAAAERLARRWCAEYPEMSFHSCTVRDRKSHIHGRVLVRTTAENRVDRHDRLAEHPVAPDGHHPPAGDGPAAPVLRADVSLRGVAPRAATRVRHATAADEEVTAFAGYYTARRTNELSRAGANPHLRQRVQDDFTVSVTAQVVGFRGACYEEVVLDVTFAVSGGEYTATLQAIPALGQVIERPTDERCPVTGLRMPYGVLGRCDRSGRLVPEHLLFRSVLSRRQAAREFLVRCAATNQTVLDDEVEVCAVTGTRAVSSEFETCSATGGRVLRAASGRSAVSDVVVRRDLLCPSNRPPHRLGLAAELVRCAVTGQTLLVDEVGVSALSGRTAALDILTASERTGRLGLPDETERCGHTGLLLLRDEVAVCAVTGKRVDSSLLVWSEASGRAALAEFGGRCATTGRVALLDELERCQLTGELVLPDQLEACAVSGQRMTRRRMVVCKVTDAWLSPAVAARSDVSGRVARPDLVLRSDRPPHRVGLPDEVGVCEFSGRTLLADELAQSAVSGRLADRDLLERVGGRLAHRSEVVRCDVTGRRLLPDETGVCSVTGRRVALDRLIRSEASGCWLLCEEAVPCSVTGKLVAPCELERCGLSGALALSSELSDCTDPPTRAIRGLLVQCSDTGDWVARTSAGRSDYRPRWLARRLLRQSERPPGRSGTADEFGVCEVTRRTLLLDELDRSAVSGRLVDRDLLVRSEQSGRSALADELVRCEESGALLLPAETGVCQASGKRVSTDLLERSPETGRLCLLRLFVTCDETGRHLPEDETEACELTGQRVVRGVLRQCAATGTRVAPTKLRKCADTGTWVVPAEIGYSDYRSRPVRKSLLRPSEKPPGRLGTAGEFGRCEATGRDLLLDELERCAATKSLVDRDLLVTCAISGERMLKTETVKCAWLCRRVGKRHAGVCGLTGATIARRFLDENRMLRPLADMLDGYAPPGSESRDDLIPMLKRIDPKYFSSVGRVYAVPAPGDGDRLALCAVVTEKGWFSARRRHTGFLIDTSSPVRIIGEVVLGERSGHEWELIRSFTLD